MKTNQFKTYIFLATLFTWLYGQSDRPCAGSGAPLLTVNSSCSFTSGTTVGANSQENGNNFGAMTCGLAGPDVWYSFIAPASGEVTITTNSGSIFDGVMSLYDSDCSTYSTELACNDDANFSMPEINYNALVAGRKYYIRFWQYGGGSGTFSICITSPAVPPPSTVNDNCSGAIPLTVGAFEVCNAVSGDVNTATNSGVAATCFGTANDDLWYSFVATNDSIWIDRFASFDSEMELFDACGGVSIGCTDIETPVLAYNLTVGATYYLRIYSYSSFAPSIGTFDVCVYEPEVITYNNNDICAQATPITMSNTSQCYSETGNVNTATSSGVNGSCFGNPNDDLWFSFIATNDSAIVSRSAAFDSEITVYDACGGTELACQDAEGGLTLTGLSIGSTYYIQMYSTYSFSPSDGSFEICVVSPSAVVDNTTCREMNPICADSPISFVAQEGTDDAENVEPGNDYDCLATSPNPSWFYLEIAQGGNLSFDITAGEDVDYVIWGPYTSVLDAQLNCDFHTNVRDCSYDASNIEQANVSNVQAGEVYVLLVTNYADAVQVVNVSSSSSNTAQTDCNGVILPVTDLVLQVRSKGYSNHISWTTSSEKDADYFQLERSGNGMDWEVVGNVTANGNTNYSSYYELEDVNYFEGVNYYRILQYDFNKSSMISEIVSINNHRGKKIIARYDALGRAVDENYKGYQIQVYSDGSVEKRNK